MLTNKRTKLVIRTVEQAMWFRFVMPFAAVVLLSACNGAPSESVVMDVGVVQSMDSGAPQMEGPCEHFCREAGARLEAHTIMASGVGGCELEPLAFDRCVGTCQAMAPGEACLDCELASDNCRSVCGAAYLSSAEFEVAMGLICWPGQEPNEDCQSSRSTRIDSGLSPEEHNARDDIDFVDTATVVSVDPLTFATVDFGRWVLGRNSSTFRVGEVVELTVERACPLFNCASRFTAFTGSTLRMAAWHNMQPPVVMGLSLENRRSDCRGHRIEEYARAIDVDLYADQIRVRPGERVEAAGYLITNGVSADLYILLAYDIPPEWRSGIVERL